MVAVQCCECGGLKRRCQAAEPLEGKEIRTLLLVTFAFQLVFTAFNALQNLHSSLHDEESLGLVCLSVIYGTGIVSSVVAPTLIGVFGAKVVLVLSFAAHCLYILANFYPSFYTMGPAAFVLGAFHGPAWTAQALYISASSFAFSKSSSTSPYTILTRFNGFFFAIFATTQIGGNLVTSTVIRDGVGNSSETTIFKYCGSEDCPALENATEIEDPEDWVIDITLGFYMGCALSGLFLTIFLLSPLPQSDWSSKVKIRSTATSCLNILLSTNMVLLVPFIMFTAMEHALLLGAFTKSFVSCPIGIHMVGYVMAAYGATTPVFLLLFTKLGRVTGRFLLIVLALIILMIILVFLYRWVPTYEDEALIFIIPMVWGLAESILQAQANALIAMLYPGQKEPAFANFHAWRNVGYTITFMNVSYLCVSTKIIIAMVCLVLGLFLYIYVEIKTKVKEKMALKEPRASMVPELVEEGSANPTYQRSVSSSSSVMSLQDRLSFDPIELADIIKEAQNGWSRDADGLTLELKKVMSKEHLSESKVTNWYHIHPSMDNIADILLSNSNPKAGKSLSRSISDGHLLSMAGKVEVTKRPKPGRRGGTYDRSVSVEPKSLPASGPRVDPSSWHALGSRFETVITSIQEVDHEGSGSEEETTENVFIEFEARPTIHDDPKRTVKWTDVLRRVKSKGKLQISEPGADTGSQSSENGVLTRVAHSDDQIVRNSGLTKFSERQSSVEEKPSPSASEHKTFKDLSNLKGKNPRSASTASISAIAKFKAKNNQNGKRSSKKTTSLDNGFQRTAETGSGHPGVDSEDDDSDGFVNDDQLDGNIDEDIENYAQIHRHKKKRVPKPASEDVSAIY